MEEYTVDLDDIVAKAPLAALKCFAKQLSPAQLEKAFIQAIKVDPDAARKVLQRATHMGAMGAVCDTHTD